MRSASKDSGYLVGGSSRQTGTYPIGMDTVRICSAQVCSEQARPEPTEARGELHHAPQLPASTSGSSAGSSCQETQETQETQSRGGRFDCVHEVSDGVLAVSFCAMTMPRPCLRRLTSFTETKRGASRTRSRTDGTGVVSAARERKKSKNAALLHRPHPWMLFLRGFSCYVGIP